MAAISLKIPNITGESVLQGHSGELDAVAIRDAVVAPRAGSSAYLTEVSLTRTRDKASPKLAEACALGNNLGEVEVFLFRNTETGQQVFLKYTLTETYVSRIEHETAEDNGGAYLPHIGYSNYGGSGASHQGVLNASGLTMNDARGYARARANPIPQFPMPPAAAVTDQEIERIWLNAATVKWTYTPFLAGVAQGAVEKGWNIQTGRPI